MKRKLITTAVSLLLCLGVVGSGFAAWVISRTTTKEVEGNFTVETVQDAVLNFDAAIANGDIHFGKPSAAAISSYQWANTAAEVKWFNDDGATEEDLTATVTLTLKNVDEWLDGYTYTLTLSMAGYSATQNQLETAKTNYTTATTNNAYITAPTYTIDDGIANNDVFTYDANTGVITVSKPTDGTTTTYTLTITVTFGWGTKFGSKNPYFYYNDHNFTDKVGETEVSYGEAASADAPRLANLLNGMGYQLTVIGTAVKTPPAQS